MRNSKTTTKTQNDAQRAVGNKKMRGLSEVVVALLMIIVAVVAVVVLWSLVGSKWLVPTGGIDLMLDPSSVITGKVGSIIVLVQSGSDSAKDPKIKIVDPATGQNAATCTITSTPKTGAYASGDKITASCTATDQFRTGYRYLVVVNVTSTNTGSTFSKSFVLTAS